MTEKSEDSTKKSVEELELEALRYFKEIAPQTDAEMSPCSVAYSEDCTKATFYFICEHRVDFRDLVKKLASHLKVSVEMRQIGERDQAAIVGGLGPCGQELCCCRMGKECCQKNSTIKMAKNQNLSLNPSKINGMCGRLMCCLRYENDYYAEFSSRAPKLHATVNTPDGEGKVNSRDAIFDRVSIRIDEEKPVKIDISKLNPPLKENERWSVSKKVWEEAKEALNSLSNSSININIDTSQFTGDDHMTRLEKVTLKSPNTSSSNLSNNFKGHKNRNKKRARTASRPGGNSSSLSNEMPKRIEKKKTEDTRKPRKRRTTKIN